MRFDKEHIISKVFSKRLRGLDEFEVRDFLHAISEEITLLRKKIKLQEAEIKTQNSLIKDYRDREHLLKESIVSAEKWAEKIRKDAEKNSQITLEKAELKAENLIQEARQSLQAVYKDIANLKHLQLQYKTGMKAALQVQMDLLDEDSIFSPTSLGKTTKKDPLEDMTSKTDILEQIPEEGFLQEVEEMTPPKKDIFEQIPEEGFPDPAGDEEEDRDEVPTWLHSSKDENKKEEPEEESENDTLSSLKDSLSKIDKDL